MASSSVADIKLADRLSLLGTETAFEVLAQAKALEAKGRHVIHFEIGEPDFDTPENVIEAAVTALRSSQTHYTPAPGTMEFRKVIAEHVFNTRQVTVSPDNVVVVPGAKPIIFYTMMALVQKGDEVIYPNPGFPIYESMINFCGGTAVPLPLYEKRNYRFDPEELKKLITPRTKMIVINTPHNPTGGILTHSELKVVADLCVQHNLLCLSDEIYDAILYEGTHESIMTFPGMVERTILLAGHSKNYAMTGWRLGYGVFPAHMVSSVSRLITNSTSCTAAFTQKAGIEALVGSQEPTVKMVAEFKARRDFIVQGLNAIGLRTLTPEGAFYVFASVDGTGVSSRQLAHYFLHHSNVAVLDGACFGQYGSGYIRLSYANSMDNLREGLRRMEQGLKELRENGIPEAVRVPCRGPCTGSSGPSASDLERLSDVGFMTAMFLSTLGNYAQTGHFGGPLSYTPANVAAHLGGGELGGLVYDIREPKHPYGDKFMLTGGHCVPTCYALWTIMYEAMARQHAASGDDRYKVDPHIGFYAVDALGFRRGPEKVKTLLEEQGLADHELFAQAKIRGIRALMGHSETTDATNDVNGGPSGVGVSTTAGKCVFWDRIGAPMSLKIVAFEGEFAFTEGHAQELKTIALAQQTGKRLRLFFSYNNAGIDDQLIGGVVPAKYGKNYDIAAQFESYGWNVFSLPDGADYEAILKTFKKMEDWPEDDRRPMVVIAKTVKGWWPTAKDGKVETADQLVSYPSHPFGLKLNSPYYVALAESFEHRFGVKFTGIHGGAVPKDERSRLIEFKTNVDVILSVLEQNNGSLRQWITDRLLKIADQFADRASKIHSTIPTDTDTFTDPRLRPENAPQEIVRVPVTHPTTGVTKNVEMKLFCKPGEKIGARKALSELGKWINYVTGNRWVTIAADLSHSINLEGASLTGHYDPVTNPTGTRLKGAIQECANAATMCGLASQTVSTDPSKHVGLWGVSGTYGAFTPFMYMPLRIYSQQNQDSPFALGKVTVVAGHSGPETAADARSHFGIFAPQTWTLFPRNQVINMYFWDYNDVVPGYLAGLQLSLRNKLAAVLVVHVARPDQPVADRATFADTDLLAAAKGCYLIREYDDKHPRHGTVLVQGSSSTVNLLRVLPRLEAAGINVRIVSVISEELFNAQSKEYQDFILPESALLDAMVITTMTKRIAPVARLGPLTDEYSMSADFDDRWRTGGLEDEVIAEAHLDTESIFRGVERFANDRDSRLGRLRAALAGLA